MNITSNIIQDILPLYYSAECSSDTKLLVEEFLHSNPGFAKTAAADFKTLKSTIPLPLTPTDEMNSLIKARKLLRARSYVLGAAIFFSLAPFSFLYTEGKFYWLFSQSLISASIYGLLGVICWGGYFILGHKTSDF